MATVCAGTLALMDAGVPIKKPVSGIAMGLISECKGTKYAILSDILGDEDHLGDMDFKTTGTRDGLTACQMDIKVDGLSYEILENALAQAHQARMHILDKIEETMPAPRADLKPHAPRIVSFIIPKDMIGAVIGPGGKIIQGIQAETGAVVSIDEVEEGGKVEVASNNGESMQAAVAKIKAIVAIPEVGESYLSTVKSIMPYGCFVEFMPGKEGLVHISELDWKRFETMEETGIKEGDKIMIKLLEVDEKTGKFRLSARALKEKPADYVEPERPARSERGPRPERRGPRPERPNRNHN
jgi:polyribonucleotide nucleotidyltransferase